MHSRHLSAEEMTALLQRAQEIDAGRLGTVEGASETESFVRAAEEAGISREAITQAMRERLQPTISDLQTGERVFAKSADGAFYVALVSKVDGPIAKVRFLNGGDHEIATADLRPFSLLPGMQVEAKWPMWGWYSVKVERFDPIALTVTLTDGMTTCQLALTEVRLPIEKTKAELTTQALLWRIGLLAAGGGTILGFLISRITN
ncbi:MAG: hypothetical protein ACOYON_00790 [Fimbriimonas sp.]